MRIDRRLLGWGLFFIVLGSVPLAVQAGLIDQDVVARWPSLWPFLLVGWGLGLLLRRTPVEWLGGGIAAVTLGLMAGGALAAGFGNVPGMTACNTNSPGTAFATQSGTFAGSGQLNVEFNCGSLTVGTVDGSGWSLEGTERNGRTPAVTTSGSTVKLESPPGDNIFNSSGSANWNVSVPKAPSLGLGVTLNAGEGSLDLAGANLASTSMTLNAGTIVLDLGASQSLGDVNATVNAGKASVGLPGGSRTANVSLNAGDVSVCVPTGTAMRVTWNGALGSNNLDAAGLTKLDDHTWVSPGFDTNQPHLELHVSANAGSFHLLFGGGCNA